MITPETFKHIEENFNRNVRKVELAIDPEHKHTEGAYGWIKKLINRGQKGLYALVEWTKLGKDAIKNKIYKYISAEYAPSYTDPETGKTYKDVLLGAALTNRPFIKGMKPVSLSEDKDKDVVLLFTEEATRQFKYNDSYDRRDYSMTKEELLQRIAELRDMAYSLDELDDEEKQALADDLGVIEMGLAGEDLDDYEYGEDFDYVPEVYQEMSEDEIRQIIREEMEPYLEALNQKVSLTEDQVEKVTNTLKSADFEAEIQSYVFNEETGEGKIFPSQVPIIKQLLQKDPETANLTRKLLEAAPAINLGEIGHSFDEMGNPIEDALSNPEMLADEAIKLAESKGISKEEAFKQLMAMTE